MCNGDTESDKETSCNEHVNVDTNRLENNTSDHDEAASDNSRTSSSNVGDVRSNWESNNASDRHDRVQKTSGRSTWVIKRCEKHQSRIL